MSYFALVGLALAWSYSLLRDAGTVTGGWSACVAAVGLVAAVYFAFSRKADAPPRPPAVLLALLFALLAFTTLQTVPLPIGIVRSLSPARAALAEALAPLTGAAARATLSNNASLTIERVIQLLCCILTLLVVRDVFCRWRHNPWTLAIPLLVMAGIEAVLGLMQYSQGANEVARGTYANRNHFAGLLEMCLPFAVMGAVAIIKRTRSRHSSPAGPAMVACILLGLAAVMLLGVLLSLSRMGFLASLSALLVTGLLSFGSGASGWKRWVPSAALGLATILGFVFLPTDQLIARFAHLADTDEISADTRGLIWKDTIKLVRDYPAVGCGFGAFEPTMARYQTVAPTRTINFAHNDYLQFTAELGVPAALAVLGLFLWVMGGTLACAAGPHRSEHQYVALACAGAFTALLLHSLVDFNMYVPANTMLAAWIAGIAEGLRTCRGRRHAVRLPAVGRPTPQVYLEGASRR